MYALTNLSPSPTHSARNRLMATCIAVSALGFSMPTHAGDVIVNFDPFGSKSTWATGINDNGAVAGYYLDSVAVQRGYVRSGDGTIKTFAPAESSATFAESIDADGSVAGFYTDATTGTQRGFLRSKGAITAFDAIYPPRPASTYAWSISNGEIAGSYSTDGSTYHGFVRRADGTVERFDPQGSMSTYATSIKYGYVTGYYSDGSNTHCFMRVPSGTIVAFDPPGSLDSRCYGIDASRWITGYYTHTDGTGTLGFLRSPHGKFRIFDGKGDAGGTYALAINGKEAITGSWYDGKGEAHGLARTPPGTMKTFDPAGSKSTHATSVNSKDSIAGYWEDSSGENHGFVRIHAKIPN